VSGATIAAPFTPCAWDAGAKNRQATAINVLFMVERIFAVRRLAVLHVQVFGLDIGLLLPGHFYLASLGHEYPGKRSNFQMN